MNSLKTIKLIQVRSPRRGCPEMFELLSSDFGSSRFEQSIEVVGPSTRPSQISADRVGLSLEELMSDFKDSDSSILYLFFGGNGTRKAMPSFGSAKLPVVFIESTHDYGMRAQPEKTFGYTSAIETLTTNARDYFEKQGKPSIFITPGREKNGLAARVAIALNNRFQKDFNYARTLFELSQSLRASRAVVISEAFSRYFGHDLESSVTSFPLEKQLKDFLAKEEVPLNALTRVTGPELEKMDYTFSSQDQSMVELMAHELSVFINELNRGEEEALVCRREHLLNYGKGGFVYYLGDRVQSRSSQWGSL